MEYKEEYNNIVDICWKTIFTKMFHNMGIKMISHKNMVIVLNYLKNINNNKNNILRLSNNYNIIYSGDSLIFVKNDIYNIHNINKSIVSDFKLNVYLNHVNMISQTVNNIKYTITTNYIYDEYGNQEFESLDDKYSYDNILNGKFSMKYINCVHNKKNQSLVKKMDNNGSNKRYFKGCVLNKFISKLCIGSACKKCIKNKSYNKYIITYNIENI
jgi:hypothetical protein